MASASQCLLWNSLPVEAVDEAVGRLVEDCRSPAVRYRKAWARGPASNPEDTMWRLHWKGDKVAPIHHS